MLFVRPLLLLHQRCNDAIAQSYDDVISRSRAFFAV